MNISDLWHSSNPEDWNRALDRYWRHVSERNLKLERAFEALDLARLRALDAAGWYDFLHDEYFRWKYTAPNRYRTTTIQLEKCRAEGKLDELDGLRQELLDLDPRKIRQGLRIAMEIPGLGTAGASGLLSLMHPRHFATVDQFVVKALRAISDLPEANEVARMNPENLSISDGVKLIGILTHKAARNNETFCTSAWTPRKIDKVLWTYGR